MALAEATLQAVDLLGLRTVDAALWKAIYDSDFTEIDLADGSVHAFASSSDAFQALEQLERACRSWQLSMTAEDSGFWVLLSENDIAFRHLLAGLAVHARNSADRPETAALASVIYLLVCRFAGAAAHKVFNHMFLRTAFGLLAGWTVAAPASDTARTGTKRKAGDIDSTAAPTKRRNVAAQAASGGGRGSAGTPAPALAQLLREMLALVNAHSLRSTPELLDEAAQTFVSITQSATAEADVRATSFQGLAALSKALHGDVNNVATVCKRLIPNVVMSFTGASSVVPKHVAAAADEATALLVSLCQTDAPRTEAPLRTFVQHVCMNIHERAPYRAKTAKSVCDIMGAMGAPSFVKMFAWVLKYSCTSKSNHRAFAVDLLANLLQGGRAELLLASEATAAATAAAPADGEAASATPTDNCFERGCAVVASRCSDKVVGVRTKALSALASLVGAATKSAHLHTALTGLFRVVVAATDATMVATPARAAMPPPKTPTPAQEPHYDDALGLEDVVLRRTHDAKSGARKAAVAALALLMIHGFVTVNASKIKALQKRCLDRILSVRKQALVSFTLVLQAFPANTSIHRPWLEAAMPLVMDREDTVKSKCVALLEEVFLAAIAGSNPNITVEAAWSLLAIVDAEQEMRRYLQRLCSTWMREGKITKTLAAIVLARAKDPALAGGWSLLAEFAVRVPKMIPGEDMVHAWRSRDESQVETTAHILSVLASTAEHMPAADAAGLQGEMIELLKGCSLSPGLIAPALGACIKLGRAQGWTEAAEKAFLAELMAKCEHFVATLALSGGAAHANLDYEDEMLVACNIFTLGEVALLCPEQISDRIVLAAQALVTPSPHETFHPTVATPTVRAHAYLALGKLCLQKDQLAKQMMPSMAHELETSPHPAVRNNIVVIMADLCIRYTSIVEQYLNNLSKRLHDDTPLIRRQTMTLLTRLLSEDYIKLKGDVFFKLASTLIDGDDSVRTLGNFCMINLLYGRDKQMFFTHFVESVFFYNDYRDHAKYNRFYSEQYSENPFSLQGVSNRSKREFLYRLFLQHCEDMDKLKIVQQLVTDVLGSVVDGKMAMTPQLEPVLRDILHVLACSDIKLKSQRKGEAGADEDEDMAGLPGAKASANLINKIVKTNFVQNIIPVVLAFKALLEKAKSPLLRDLMAYLSSVMKEYKEEVNDILAANRQLAQEILFDLQKFEAETASRRTSISSIGTPSMVSPHLKPATPQGASPLLNSSLFASNPGSPKYAPPKLRQTPSSTRTMSRLHKKAVHAAAISASVFQTPTRGKDPAGQPPPDTLDWTRTPEVKSKTVASRLQAEADPIIFLESPNKPLTRAETKWNVSPAVAGNHNNKATPKRFEDIAEDDLGMSADENADSHASPVATRKKPRSSQRLSKGRGGATRAPIRG